MPCGTVENYKQLGRASLSQASTPSEKVTRHQLTMLASPYNTCLLTELISKPYYSYELALLRSAFFVTETAGGRRGRNPSRRVGQPLTERDSSLSTRGVIVHKPEKAYNLRVRPNASLSFADIFGVASDLCRCQGRTTGGFAMSTNTVQQQRVATRSRDIWCHHCAWWHRRHSDCPLHQHQAALKLPLARWFGFHIASANGC